MSHTLHREGTVESLKGDYVVLCMSAQGLNKEGSGPKFQRYFEIARQFHPGEYRRKQKHPGRSPHLITIRSWQKTDDGCVCLAVFDNPESVIGFLTALKKEDLGLSVVVSGLMDQVKECCDHAGLKVHTINLSLGTFGKTEKMGRSPGTRDHHHVRSRNDHRRSGAVPCGPDP